MKPSEALEAALNLLGPNGEHWIKGNYRNECRTAWCMAGALIRVTDDVLVEIKAHRYLTRLLGTHKYATVEHSGNLVRFNDHPDTTFVDLRSLVEDGIALARAEAQ